MYNKNPTEFNKCNYKKQRNICVSLLAKEKKKYYNNLDLKIFNDNSKFWQNIQPLFSNKCSVSQKNIMIIEKNIITSKNDVAEKLNTIFIKAVENLGIEPFVPNVNNNIQTESIAEIIKTYERHPSILKIRENVNDENEKVIFMDITPKVMKNKINKLDPKKASVENYIPTKILIVSQDILGGYLSHIIILKIITNIPRY